MEQSMKSRAVNNSKYRNTGVLFELIIRQITADSLSGKSVSEAVNILKKYFNTSTELGKELQLYRAFMDGQPLSEAKAFHYIDLVLEQRRKLDENKLNREKYDLISEVKKHYPLKDFLSCKIPSYVIHASIYKTFLNEAMREDSVKVVNLSDIAEARFTLVEHLTGRNSSKKAIKKDDVVLKEYREQPEEIRVLTYKLLVDKFNDKYSNLNDEQKTLLREYINNVANTNSLVTFMKSEVPKLQRRLTEGAKKLNEKVVQIKVTEVASQLANVGSGRVVKDSEVTALMLAYEIAKEINA
jgi:hypothetical protein